MLLRSFARISPPPVGLFLILVFLTVIYAFRHVRSLTIALSLSALTTIGSSGEEQLTRMARQ